MDKKAYIEKLRDLADEAELGKNSTLASWIKDIADELEAMDVVWVKNKPLPCSVMLPPATVVSRGVAIGTLLRAIDLREGNPVSHLHFDSDSAKELRAMLAAAEEK